MVTETLAHNLFWVLLGGAMAMRIYFTMRVRHDRERLMPDREAVRREGTVIFAGRVVLFFLLMVLILLYVFNIPWMAVFSVPFPGWLRWSGFVLGLASLVFWTWAQMTLGKEWSPQLQLREQHRLVTTGPYALVRHPIYTAMFGYAISLALLTANWFFIALTILVISGIIARVPKEERMMIEEFGEEYKAYIRRTGKFIPRFK